MQSALGGIPDLENAPMLPPTATTAAAIISGPTNQAPSGANAPSVPNDNQPKENAAGSDAEAAFVPLMGKALLKRVKYDTERTLTPDWFKAAPVNMGDVKQGKLSSKEWRNAFTLNFLITLPRQWGNDYDAVSPTQKHKVLDNFFHLILAILLSTQRTMTEEVVRLYEIHFRAYLEGFRDLYPTQTITPYQHVALGHFPHFLRMMGPWDNWNTGGPETWIGMSQKIPTNSRFGACCHSICEQPINFASIIPRRP